MSVSVGQAHLQDALKKLRIQWAETRSRWKDGVAEEFEETFWTPLEGGANTTLAALDRLAQVLVELRKDCGMEGEDFDLTIPSGE